MWTEELESIDGRIVVLDGESPRHLPDSRSSRWLVLGPACRLGSYNSNPIADLFHSTDYDQILQWPPQNNQRRQLAKNVCSYTPYTPISYQSPLQPHPRMPKQRLQRKQPFKVHTVTACARPVPLSLSTVLRPSSCLETLSIPGNRSLTFPGWINSELSFRESIYVRWLIVEDRY